MPSSQQQVNEGVPELDLSGLQAALTCLYEARALVGRIPPGPATLRARAGEVMIRSVRRTLFWLIPQLDGFHAAAVQCADEQLSIISQLVAGEAILREELGRLRMGAPAGTALLKSYADRTPEQWLESIRHQAALSVPQAPTDCEEDTQEVQGSAGL